MGQCGPHVQFFAACLGVTIALWIAATGGGASVFMVGAGVGGIGQSFLVSNRFSEVDPALGQGVPCLIGALGTGGSCLSWIFWSMKICLA